MVRKMERINRAVRQSNGCSKIKSFICNSMQSETVARLETYRKLKKCHIGMQIDRGSDSDLKSAVTFKKCLKKQQWQNYRFTKVKK